MGINEPLPPLPPPYSAVAAKKEGREEARKFYHGDRPRSLEDLGSVLAAPANPPASSTDRIAQEEEREKEDAKSLSLFLLVRKRCEPSSPPSAPLSAASSSS